MPPNKTIFWVIPLIVVLVIVIWFLVAARQPGQETTAPSGAPTRPITEQERRQILESLAPESTSTAPSQEISAKERARILESLQPR